MADRPIQVGDLVQVVKWPCCEKYIGRIFTVTGLKTPHELICGCGWSAPAELIAETDRPKFIGAPVACLKRIPPLEELEGARTQEDLREPA